MAAEPPRKRARAKVACPEAASVPPTSGSKSSSSRPAASVTADKERCPPPTSVPQKAAAKSTAGTPRPATSEAERCPPPASIPQKSSAKMSAGPAITRVSNGAVAKPKAKPNGTATRTQDGQGSENRGVAFLRLSSDSQPSTPVSPLIYLNKDEVTVGRLPSNDVVMDSARTPQMISRVHGKLTLRATKATEKEWVIIDCNSINGITVNGEKVPLEGQVLRPGDLINFGRRVNPPEFEFVFEAPFLNVSTASPVEAVAPPPDEAIGEQLARISELEIALKAEREQNQSQAAEALKRRQAASTALNVSEISSELACSICRDWLVHAATIECSHSFCWSCVDRWLQTKQFFCPMCRKEVTREPVRTRAVDTIVQKTVQRLPTSEQDEFKERVAAAEAAEATREKHLTSLQKSVDNAIKGGKNFFSINSNWGKRDKDIFSKGIKEYTGSARETYCRLTGLTVQWVHSADPDKLNQALHNLALASYVGRPEEEIRRRLLMFLRYG